MRRTASLADPLLDIKVTGKKLRVLHLILRQKMPLNDLTSICMHLFLTSSSPLPHLFLTSSSPLPHLFIRLIRVISGSILFLFAVFVLG